MPDDLDLTQVQDSTPDEAPVTEPEPLTGKEKAGVSLTWGIIWVLIVFLLLILAIFIWGECRFFGTISDLTHQHAGATAPAQSEQINTALSAIRTERAAFRAFWFDTLQLILLNVLFPTLTALLGYVFGTSRNGNGQT